jgi:hypothetical protein
MAKQIPHGVWERLIQSMPARIQEAYDPLAHLTVDDLMALTQTEIDLHEEGEWPMRPSVLARVQAYQRRLIHAYEGRWEAAVL